MNFNFMTKLLPPDDPKKLTQWRWIVAMSLLLLLFNGAIGRGLMFAAGSYAYASDVATNGQKIDRILALNIASTLRGLREDECRANGNKALIRSTMEDYQQDYEALKGKRYPLISCKDLMET